MCTLQSLSYRPSSFPNLQFSFCANQGGSSWCFGWWVPQTEFQALGFDIPKPKFWGCLWSEPGDGKISFAPLHINKNNWWIKMQKNGYKEGKKTKGISLAPSHLIHDFTLCHSFDQQIPKPIAFYLTGYHPEHQCATCGFNEVHLPIPGDVLGTFILYRVLGQLRPVSHSSLLESGECASREPQGDFFSDKGK